MDQSSLSPILFPNGVWLGGIFLIVVALVWGIGLLVAYSKSQVNSGTVLRPLSESRRERYRNLLREVSEGFNSGELSPRQAHLALRSVIRAAATERLGTNVESLTVAELRQAYPSWPQLAEALQWCEEPAFSKSHAEYEIRLQRGIEAATGVIQQ